MSEATRAQLEAQKSNELYEKYLSDRKAATEVKDGQDEAQAPPTEPQQPSASSVPPNQPDGYEQRYKVMQWKYNAEVPRLQQTVRELTAQVEKLTARPVEKPKLVKDEEVSEYGEGLIDVIRRAAREEVSTKDAEIEDLRAQLARVATTQAGNADQTYFDALTREVPDWRTVNDDPKFHEWLTHPDEFSGIARQDLLTEQHGRRNLGSVTRIFNAFKRQAGQAVAKQQERINESVVPESLPLDVTPKDGQKKIWTNLEVAKFYDDVKRGLITERDAATTDREIALAAAEGRIRSR